MGGLLLRDWLGIGRLAGGQQLFSFASLVFSRVLFFCYFFLPLPFFFIINLFLSQLKSFFTFTLLFLSPIPPEESE